MTEEIEEIDHNYQEIDIDLTHDEKNNTLAKFN